MNNVIPFPVDQVEHYTIDYDPVSHAVDIPLVPDEVMPAVCILDRFIREIIESGTLTADDLNLVFLNATDQLSPEIYNEEDE